MNKNLLIAIIYGILIFIVLSCYIYWFITEQYIKIFSNLCIFIGSFIVGVVYGSLMKEE